MNRFRPAVLWAALLAIIILGLLSVYGAFIGAERAQVFFTSLPLAVYWLVLMTLLVAGVFLFRRLLRVPSLLLMHVGPILVLIGGMWGSQAGHAFRNRRLGTDKVREGQMVIFEGTQVSDVYVAKDGKPHDLPFLVRLKDFRMEYYNLGYLSIADRQGRDWRLPASPGARLSLGEGLGELTVKRIFENFRIGMDGQGAYDAPGGSNPAVEITLEKPGEAPATRYAFEQFPGHASRDEELLIRYGRVVSDYISEIEIIADGQVVAAKEIEVNHPLHYGGYHFYQHYYGQDRGREYTILMVVSDSGLNVVYAGFMLLVAGIVWHFWCRRAFAGIGARRLAVAQPEPMTTEIPDQPM